MTVPLFIESSHEIPMVHVRVAFEGGGAPEPPGKDGLALVTAKMLKRGCTDFSAAQIEDRVDALGASLSCGDVRTTSSVIDFDVLRRSLDPMVDLVGRLIGRPTFEEGPLAALLREIESGLMQAREDEHWVLNRETDRLLFGSHPFGRKVTRASLRSITREDVLAHYAKHYAHGDAVAISGDITRAQAEDVATRLFEHQVVVAKGKAPPHATLAEPTPVPGRKLVFVDKPGRTQCFLTVSTLGTHFSDPDHHALQVANFVFGGGFNCRLMEEVRVKRGWSYGAASSLSVHRARTGWTVSAQPKGEDAAGCLALLLELIHKFREEGMTAAEVDRMKAYIIQSNAFTVATPSQRAGKRLTTHLYGLPLDYYASFPEKIAAVSVEAANAAVRRRLSEQDLVIGVYGAYDAWGPAIESAIPQLASTRLVSFDAD